MSLKYIYINTQQQDNTKRKQVKHHGHTRSAHLLVQSVHASVKIRKKTKTKTGGKNNEPVCTSVDRGGYLNVALESSNLREQQGIRSSLLAVVFCYRPQPRLQGYHRVETEQGKVK